MPMSRGGEKKERARTPGLGFSGELNPLITNVGGKIKQKGARKDVQEKFRNSGGICLGAGKKKKGRKQTFESNGRGN